MSKQVSNPTFTNVALAIHGGAGVINRNNMKPSVEREYRKKLETALRRGYRVLEKGGSALDAVEATIRYMEDCPLFNAGRGSVFTDDGRIEMDAALMDGSNRRVGAVAALTTIKNPISAARAVMDKSEHVLLIGKGAEKFARRAGLETAEQSYFWTQQQWDRFELVRGKESKNGKGHTRVVAAAAIPDKYGTVGAIAVDQNSNLAAATSTGGILNKHWGRVGDSPIIGAGVFAENETCAISCTGHGEYFMRFLVAYEVSMLMRHKKLPLIKAAHQAIHELLTREGGKGGLIALDRRGNCAMPFNSEGMFRGCITTDGAVHVGIYG